MITFYIVIYVILFILFDVLIMYQVILQEENAEFDFEWNLLAALLWSVMTVTVDKLWTSRKFKSV